jgi:hypothetical protein
MADHCYAKCRDGECALYFLLCWMSCWVSLWLVSCWVTWRHCKRGNLANKHKAWLERLAKDKRSSLLVRIVSNKEKKVLWPFLLVSRQEILPYRHCSLHGAEDTSMEAEFLKSVRLQMFVAGVKDEKKRYWPYPCSYPSPFPYSYVPTPVPTTAPAPAPVPTTAPTHMPLSLPWGDWQWQTFQPMTD